MCAPAMVACMEPCAGAKGQCIASSQCPLPSHCRSTSLWQWQWSDDDGDAVTASSRLCSESVMRWDEIMR